MKREMTKREASEVLGRALVDYGENQLVLGPKFIQAMMLAIRTLDFDVARMKRALAKKIAKGELHPTHQEVDVIPEITRSEIENGLKGLNTSNALIDDPEEVL